MKRAMSPSLRLTRQQIIDFSRFSKTARHSGGLFRFSSLSPKRDAEGTG